RRSAPPYRAGPTVGRRSSRGRRARSRPPCRASPSRCELASYRLGMLAERRNAAGLSLEPAGRRGDGDDAFGRLDIDAGEMRMLGEVRDAVEPAEGDPGGEELR